MEEVPAVRQEVQGVGLEIDPNGSKDKEIVIGHTEERRSELLSKINDILAEDWLDAKEAERLRGRMIFFEGFTFGRTASEESWTILR